MRIMKSEIVALKQFVVDNTQILINGDYNECIQIRRTFNVCAIELLLGKHFAPVGDKNWKLKGVHKLPSADELSEIIKLVDEFYTLMPDKSDEDMECISVTPDIDPSTPLSGKELEQYIMNLMNQDLTVTDFINISQLGKSLRKKFWKNTFIDRKSVV